MEEGRRGMAVMSIMIFVAVGKELSNYRSTLRWVMENFWGMEICILYVHVPSQIIPIPTGGEVHASQLGEEDLAAFRERERLEMLRAVDYYVDTYGKITVQNPMGISHSANSIEEGIVEVISQKRVGRLIMGAATDTGYLSHMGAPTSTKANYVRQHAPKYCQVQFICRGKLIYTREGVEPLNSDIQERLSDVLGMYEPFTGAESTDNVDFYGKLEKAVSNNRYSRRQQKAEIEGICQEYLAKRVCDLQLERDEALEDAKQLRKQLVERTLAPSIPKLFSLISPSDLKNATNNFDVSTKIGQGCSGFIYKGLLGHTEVAIKVINPDDIQGLLKFQREMDALSNLRHPNLVTLVGACLESRALIYEYLRGGSLEDRLNCKDNSPPLPWQTRIRIATELCSVVVFLHSSEPSSIIHGDLKPGNILLNENLVCKLSDFGICHLISRSGENLTNQDTTFFTNPRGTFYYMDPEFLTTGVLSRKSDVYSFGIILLRLLTGKPAISIADVVSDALDSNNLKSILDSSAGEWPFSHAEDLARTGLSCCQMKKRNRPDLLEVWRVLKLIKTSCTDLSMHQQVSDEEDPAYFHSPIFQEYLAERLRDLELEKDNALEEAKQLRKQLDEKLSTPSTPKLFSHFTTSDIKNATNNFDPSTIIGQGGYGFIFKGLLGQTEVAIKVLHPESKQGPLEFEREMDALSNLQHPNLVNLVGACLESRSLIYQYLHGGNLEDRLKCKDNSPPLHWQTRVRIANELCSVLVFLHSNEPKSIIHGDLKPSNILLDENMVCKLSDFGICHLISRTAENSAQQDTSFFTGPRGSFYYMDPEFLPTGLLSRKSDVYSVGVILLQLLTGKPALAIADAVKVALASDNLKSILDPLAGEWPYVHAQEIARMALLCCQIRKIDRPELGEVWRFLKLVRASSIGLSTHKRVSDDQPPAYFLCPIFLEIMEDPHFAADGFTYEKNAIEGWLAFGRDSSPMTNTTLQDHNIVPNRALHSAIQEWLQQNDTP